jgi:hypothetical protein
MAPSPKTSDAPPIAGASPWQASRQGAHRNTRIYTIASHHHRGDQSIPMPAPADRASMTRRRRARRLACRVSRLTGEPTTDSLSVDHGRA